MKHAWIVIVITLATLSLAALSHAADKDNKDDKPAKKTISPDVNALAPFRSFVGGWKGVAFPKRGSAEGAWQEDGQWAWQFQDGRAALIFEAADGRIYKSARLEPTDKKGKFRFIGTLPDGKTTEQFTGSPDDDGVLVLATEKPAKDRPAQITMRTVAQGDRLLILYNKQAGPNQFIRLAQIGYTRRGSGFGKGGGGNECVITGGQADFTVTYKGQKYYLCCKGCRDLFNQDPEAALAEYRLRKQKEKEKQEAEDKQK